jgi:hypothetical protein
MTHKGININAEWAAPLTREQFHAHYSAIVSIHHSEDTEIVLDEMYDKLHENDIQPIVIPTAKGEIVITPINTEEDDNNQGNDGALGDVEFETGNG